MVKLPVMLLLLAFLSGTATLVCAQNPLKAGASAVDITPTKFPVIRNGGFVEGQILLAEETLHARCLVLEDEDTRLAVVMVDSCMIPRTLCDEVKERVDRSAGLARENILIAATHTHSAPSVMNFCLGSRADPEYTAFLVPKLVEALERAAERLQPAKVAWGQVDAGEFTNCRRWITRADKMQVDPFGERTVRAMMHPGYQSPDFVGPSGPKDPWLSFLSVQTEAGKPLALLGNFSMHYFSGHAGASPDYFGHFNRLVEARLAPEDPEFVSLHSQGTSGDLWWADYSQPKIERDIQSYAAALADRVVEASAQKAHQAAVPLAMAEERMILGRRLPSEKRLAWAREKLEAMEGRRPKDRPEVYAEQALFLHENPTEEVVLQAIRIGDLGIAAMPNEVYALTGLKMRWRSPLPVNFTIELANGAAGYIPPPEQHALGGYNTWPARTAGLEVQAEPKIAERTLQLLEQVGEGARKAYTEPLSAYAQAVLELEPGFYLRLGELEGPHAVDASSHGRDGLYEGGVAYHVPGARDGKAGERPYASRSVHLVDGKVGVDGKALDGDFSIVLEFWNGLTAIDREEEGTLIKIADLRVGIRSDERQRFQCYVGSQDEARLGPHVSSREWHQLSLVRQGENLAVSVNGPKSFASLSLESSWRADTRLEFGEGLQGRLDEVAFFPRALSAEELQRLGRAR